MSPHGSVLARLADWTYRRRRVVVVGWVVALVAALGAASQLAGEFTADYATEGSESAATSDRLAERFPGRSSSTVDVVWSAASVSSPGVAERVDRMLASAQGLEGIGDGVTTAQARVSDDERVAMVRLPLSIQNPNDVPGATGDRLLELADEANGSGLRVEVGGQVVDIAQQDELSSESVGLLVAAAVLLLTFGSLVAAGLPLATALFGLGVSSALVGLLAAVLDVPDWAPSVAAMIGIGVGIDYALLIVTRFRGALGAGLDPRAATVEAIRTAGRSVLVAGTTVVISLTGLFLMGLTYLYGVALAAIISVLVVMAASITLLPALLGFARGRVERLRIPGTGRGVAVAAPEATLAARWSRLIQRRPWTAVLAGTAVLLALAAPVSGLRLGFPDAGTDSEGTTTRQAYDLAASGFGVGAAGPLLLVADDRGTVDRVVADVRDQAGVAAVSAPAVSPDGSTTVVEVTPETAPQDPATAELVRSIRDQQEGVLVGGQTAAFVDQSDVTADRLPLFIGGVVVLSFLLLVAAFRAPLVALKAGVLNLLSIGAAYGVVALAADGGAAGQLLGIDTEMPVPPFIPVMMFAVLFGLSMDYEVFLLSRIREEVLGGKTTSRAVADGLARTARVITAAAAIMVAVFGAFVLSDDVVLQLIGVGLATAILVDATIVRMILVPAVMQLLGERTWWLPRWLDRLIPRAGIEASSA